MVIPMFLTQIEGRKICLALFCWGTFGVFLQIFHYPKASVIFCWAI